MLGINSEDYEARDELDKVLDDVKWVISIPRHSSIDGAIDGRKVVPDAMVLDDVFISGMLMIKIVNLLFVGLQKC